jgi:hypothetical protein
MHSQPSKTSPVIDASWIKKFITVKPDSASESGVQSTSLLPELLEQDLIANLITKLRDTNPVIHRYMTLVFTHLEGFHIRPMSSSENFYPSERISPLASFSAGGKYVLFPQFDQKNIFFTMELYRHELRHAAMNTVQQILSGIRTISTECFFPRTSQEKEKIQRMIKKGDNKVEWLRKLLQRESQKKTINKKDRKLLQKLRKGSKEDYFKYYQQEHPLRIPNHLLEHLGEMKTNQIVNMDKFKPRIPLGNFIINKMVPVPPSETILFLNFQDPLYSAISKIDFIKLRLNNSYKEERRILEFDAHLYALIPVSIIKYLYTEFYHYTSNLIDSASLAPALKLFEPIPYRDQQELIDYDFWQLFNMPGEMDYSLAECFLKMTDPAIKLGYIKETIACLQSMIRHGYFVDRAKSILASIHPTEDYGELFKQTHSGKKNKEPSKASTGQVHTLGYFALRKSHKNQKQEMTYKPKAAKQGVR